jgi:hypothetical protein
MDGRRKKAGRRDYSMMTNKNPSHLPVKAAMKDEM